MEPHPAKGHLALRRITNTQVAAGYGCSAVFVGRVLLGYVRPPERFRRYVSELIGLPEDELFRREDVSA